jgi:hypothetical protein
MTLSVVELEEEAKEQRDDKAGAHVLMHAAQWEGMEAVMERIQSVWPGSLNATGKGGLNAIMDSAFGGSADNIRALAIMGADLSLNSGLKSGNVFNLAKVSNMKASILSALAEHGVTSSNILPGFQSPLYFRSIYYASHVRTQRWLNRSVLMLCVDKVYKWSLLNQIEDEKYRTLPDDLSTLGRFIAHCWFDVAGGDNKIDEDKPDNGIARLILSFAAGINVERDGPLIGMPEFGKNNPTLPKCSSCKSCYADALAGMIHCCGAVYYCRGTLCQKNAWKKHEPKCERPEVVQMRTAKAAAAAKAARKSSKKKKK